MQTLKLFSSRVMLFEVDAPEGLNAALLDALTTEAGHTPGIVQSNRGGWHSVPDIALRPDPIYRTYCQMVVRHARQAVQAIAAERGVTLPPFTISLHAWAMVMGEGAYTVLHDHGEATLAGPYYLDAGDADLEAWPTSGMISFTDPRRSSSRVRALDLFTSTVTLQPRAGQLALFPGYLQHFVHPYEGQRPRVCIANNFLLIPEST